MADFKIGDQVNYRHGRGESLAHAGEVIAVEEKRTVIQTMLTIKTRRGRIVRRKAEKCEVIQANEPAAQ